MDKMVDCVMRPIRLTLLSSKMQNSPDMCEHTVGTCGDARALSIGINEKNSYKSTGGRASPDPLENFGRSSKPHICLLALQPQECTTDPDC